MPPHTYLIAKHPHSEGANCPAVYGTGTGDYVVVGEVLTDHGALSAGVAHNEAAVAVPRPVLAAVLRDELPGDHHGVVTVEVSAESDVVVQEAGHQGPARLVIDNGAVEWQLLLAGDTVRDRLTVIDKLLSQLSELRVAVSEDAAAWAGRRYYR